MGTTITKATSDAVKKAALADIYTDLEKIKARQEDDSRYLGKRIDSLSQRLDIRIDSLDKKIDNLAERMDNRIDSLDRKIDSLGLKLERQDEKIEKLGDKLDNIIQLITQQKS